MTLTNQAPPLGLPPGPRWPRPAQTLRFGLDPYGLFESAHRAFGDVFTLRVMAETWVILAHPDAVRELYRHGPDELDSAWRTCRSVRCWARRTCCCSTARNICAGASSCCRRFYGERMLAWDRREVAAAASPA